RSIMALGQRNRPLRRVAAIVASLALLGGLAPAQQAHADETILSLDFSDGYAPLVNNGNPVLEVVELDGDQVLSVQGRDADYVGVSTPPDMLIPGETYAVSVDVRLADGLPASQARLVGVPG